MRRAHPTEVRTSDLMDPEVKQLDVSMKPGNILFIGKTQNEADYDDLENKWMNVIIL